VQLPSSAYYGVTVKTMGAVVKVPFSTVTLTGPVVFNWLADDTVTDKMLALM
jgi:hypothetical protein